jgi:hypothetical protein
MLIYKWRGVTPGRIEFFCKEWTKTVKDLHFGIAAKFFLKKEKRFS